MARRTKGWRIVRTQWNHQHQKRCRLFWRILPMGGHGNNRPMSSCALCRRRQIYHSRMSTILVGARVIDWPALMRQLQDEASLQGWTLASKVQKRPSEHPGWGGPCYCTKQGCTWRVVLSKERDSSASTISSANMEHTHSLEQKTHLPASHTWRNEAKVRKSLESHISS